MMALLFLFGGAIAGGLLDALTWWGAAASLVFLFVVRPVAGMLSLIGTARPLGERAALAFFGIRGLGSFYYLAYAMNEEGFEPQGRSCGRWPASPSWSPSCCMA
jgi:NhaP-type Na+/H+ or K+/H+ antiporter